MCANPNTSNEEKAVFEEINTWSRHLANGVWLFASFFIGLNFIAIKLVFSDLGEHYIKCHFGSLPCWVRLVLSLILALTIFAILWLTPALVVLSAIRISENVGKLLNKNKYPKLKKEDLNKALRFEWDDLKKEIQKDIWKALKYPLGWIILVFTILFLSAWLWIFLGFFN